MSGPSNRRDFLTSLSVLLGGASMLPRILFGQQSAGSIGHIHSGTSGKGDAAQTPIAATRLSENLVLITGAGGNVIVVTGPDDLVMVNGGLGERSHELLAFVAQSVSAKPIRTLINTDWHPEHTGSNGTLGKAGAAIVAHENTKQYLSSDVFVDWQKRTYKSLPPEARPTRTFYTSGKMTCGNERIEYGQLGQAHTDGDIYVFFPVSNVLVAGDVLSVGKYPIADYTTGGWLGGLGNATKALLDLTDAETRVVPGIGPLQTRADLQAQHEMLVALKDRFVKMMKQGMGVDDMIAAGATKDFDERWGNSDVFVSTTYQGMWLHVRELGGIV
jgi:cyclase